MAVAVCGERSDQSRFIHSSGTMAADPKQRLRIRRFGLAMAYYAIWITLTLLAQSAGMLRLDAIGVATCIGGVVASNVAFFMVFRSGLNQRLRDPGVTLQQLIVGLVWALVLLHATVPAARGLMLTALIIPMLFGMFQLEKRGYLLLGSLALGGYTGIAAATAGMPGAPTLGVELMRVAVLASAILWTSLFSLHARRLRQCLQKQNRTLKTMLAEISELAERDELTKAYNRRYIMESLQEEKKRADRTRMPFSICIFDLDHFKEINDRYGHITGDRVLVDFVERLRSELRYFDALDRREDDPRFARYGGEEFILLLPHTNLSGARHCAERIRSITADARFASRCHITVSVGVAEFRIGESIESTLRRADGALYLSKQLGRNRVETSDEFSSAWRDPQSTPPLAIRQRPT